MNSTTEIIVPLGSLGKAKVMRRLVAGGPDSRYIIECAVLEDGISSPASDALNLLESGMLEPDPDHKAGQGWPDEEQPSDFIKLMGMFQVLIDDGLPTHRDAVNDLEEGIWEFKVSQKRFTWFDTDDMGGFDPKFRIMRKDASEHDDDYWWFPEFDQVLRLGHWFPKLGKLAGQDNIDESIRIRREDLAHDE